MKIIDLLNKMANKEPIPNSIEHKGTIYTYDETYQDYFCGDDISCSSIYEDSLFESLFSNKYHHLNDDVHEVLSPKDKMKSIKIIDFLDIIADGGPIPKKVFYKEELYIYDIANCDYWNWDVRDYFLAQNINLESLNDSILISDEKIGS